MDIYTFIRNDHMNAREAISRINMLEQHQHSRRMELFRELKESLISHNEAEAATFYTALSVVPELKEQIRHSEKEHHEVDEMLEDLSDPGLNPNEWKMKFEEFQRALFNHIAEEEGKVFYQAQQLIPHSLSVELAGQMEHLKRMRKQVIRQAKAGSAGSLMHAAF